MDEILDECTPVVDEVCEKYGYDTEDKENNDCLRTVLLKAIPCMLKGAKKEDRDIFYQMLRNTPIVITDRLTSETHKELEDKYIGNVNPHIIDAENEEIGEYGKIIPAGAFVTEPILDENLEVKGKKTFIYVQKAEYKARDFFKSEVNVAHLMHELGHAWHSEVNMYTMQDDGKLHLRVGTAEYIYSFSKREDGKFVKTRDSANYLMIEEGMNTLEEEACLAEYMGISSEEMQERYRDTLVLSNYQGYISSFVDYMLENLSREDFENWRLHGDLESKRKIETLMAKTKYWENRRQDILTNSDSPRNYEIKRKVISRCKSESVQAFFKEYEDTYFPDVSRMSPLQKIDNVLFQRFNLHMMQYNMEIENYRDFIERLGYEGYSLINQSSDLLKSEELANAVSSSRLSDVNAVTAETNALAQAQIQEQVHVPQIEQGEEK